jgi:hypothetical protein
MQIHYNQQDQTVLFGISGFKVKFKSKIGIFASFTD